MVCDQAWHWCFARWFCLNPAIALLTFLVRNRTVYFFCLPSGGGTAKGTASGGKCRRAGRLSCVVFLLAPPLLGAVAEFFGIHVSFGIALPMVVLSGSWCCHYAQMLDLKMDNPTQRSKGCFSPSKAMANLLMCAEIARVYG